MTLVIPSPLNNSDFLGGLFHQMEMHADSPLDARFAEGMVSTLEPLKRDLERMPPSAFYSVTKRTGDYYTRLQHRGEEGRRYL